MASQNLTPKSVTKQLRIMRRHIGRPLDFKASDGQILNGHVLKVRNGIATVEYCLRREAFVTYMPVRDASIIEIY